VNKIPNPLLLQAVDRHTALIQTDNTKLPSAPADNPHWKPFCTLPRWICHV